MCVRQGRKKSELGRTQGQNATCMLALLRQARIGFSRKVLAHSNQDSRVVVRLPRATCVARFAPHELLTRDHKFGEKGVESKKALVYSIFLAAGFRAFHCGRTSVRSRPVCHGAALSRHAAILPSAHIAQHESAFLVLVVASSLFLFFRPPGFFGWICLSAFLHCSLQPFAGLVFPYTL